MPVSVVVGGQFGSEGKGKAALEIVRRDKSVAAIVRVGGPNSGHTGVTREGAVLALRQIPAGAIDGNVLVVLPSGSYVDVDVLLSEVRQLGLRNDQLAISPLAHVITEDQKAWERAGKLPTAIGSTGSGTGAAVMARIARHSENFPLAAVKAADVRELQPFLRDNTTTILRHYLDVGRRVVLEGTQGFGLSLLHSEFWPKATSRDTTAAGFVAEAGLSPLDVDDVTLVLRCHPIRVAGDSGPLLGEMSWAALAHEAMLPHDLCELTTVTRKVRRVGRFDPALVREAIAVNRPTRVILNHLDYVDPGVQGGHLTEKARSFIQMVETSIGLAVDWFGVGPGSFIENERPHRRNRAAVLVRARSQS